MTKAKRVARFLQGGVSATALCVAGLAAPAFAQSTSPTGAQAGPGTAGASNPSSAATGNTGTQIPAGEAPSADVPTNAPADAGANQSGDVIVTGIRQSLANAQNIKRNSDTIEDAITASDIGALPDRSVTEALQRVPGVSINRFAGANDPDHFSVEGSGVNVRGLNFVRSEFNGRDTFSAGVGGQAINFADVPAELLGSVEVYKETTGEMIEGGLAGTVNLNTRKPFDNKGLHIGVDAEANYGDFEKKWSPTGSLLVSDTWETGAGTFGLLADVSYSRIRSRADGIQVTNVQTRDNTPTIAANSTALICRNPLPGNGDATTLPATGAACGAASTTGADGFADPRALSYAPIGGQFRTQEFDRKRDGQAVAAQWRSNDERALLTAQFLRSHSTNSWGEHSFETASDLSEYDTYPAGCVQNGDGAGGTTRAECPAGSLKNYTYDSNNLFQSGFITQPGTGYRTASSGSPTSNVPTGGAQQNVQDRQVNEENLIKDYGLNLKVNPDNHWAINLDADYTQAVHNDVDFAIIGSTFADEELDLSGAIPSVTPHKPLTLSAAWATPNPRIVGENDAQYFQDKNVQFWRAADDHFEHSTGDEYAVKGDFDYKFNDGSFLNHVKFGARYAERDETVRYTTYNWGVLSEVWAGSSPVSFAQAGGGNETFYNFPNFFRGETAGPSGAYYYNGDLIKGYNDAATFAKSIANIWNTTNGANQSTWTPAAQRAGVVPGTPFLPSEIQKVKQQDTDSYAQLNFGSPNPLIGGIRIAGNVGLRYVSTDVTSAGSLGAPTQAAVGVDSPYAVRCAPQTVTLPNGTVQTASPGGVCNLGAAGYAALQQFATGLTVNDVARNSYQYFLPSVNLKFGVTDKLVVRLAGSKVLTRPDLSDIRNFITVGFDPNSGAPTATAGNPYLKPATAWQFDATAEWYFARVGSLTVDAFYKSIHNFFYSSIFNRDINSNGVTEAVQIRGPANYDGYGKIKGVEAAYQQTFDFLPGPLSGLGVNLNYTFLDSSGLPNSFLNPGTGTPATTSTITPGNLPLEGLSKHNVNAEVFYEKGPVSLRAAYNWRSRFLLTAADVVFPYTSIFNDATGQLDASGFVNINRYVKIGIQGVNLTNEVTKTLQAYTGNPNQLAPRSYFVNDRRYSFILRANF